MIHFKSKSNDLVWDSRPNKKNKNILRTQDTISSCASSIV